MRGLIGLCALAFAAALAPPARAQDSAGGGGEDSAALAQKLSNPVAAMISIPIQSNYDCCFGPSNGGRWTINFQPVVPFQLSDKLTLITRTILPVIDQQPTVSGASTAWGFGDITQSFFLSPTPKPGGIIWGAGPVFLWPVGNGGFSSHQWGAGPTLVVLKQTGPVTVGLLADQLWSYAGRASDPKISQLFLQPFLSYQLKSATTLSLNTESSYDWVGRQWTVPINFGVSQILKFGQQPISLGATGKYYAVAPGGQPGWGVRFTATLIIPK